jgi:hypothetical protein
VQKIMLNYNKFLYFFLFVFFSEQINSLEKTHQKKMSHTCAAFENLNFNCRNDFFLSTANTQDLHKLVNQKINRGFKWLTVPMNSEYIDQNSILLPGTSIILMEYPQTNFFFTHFFHLLEHLLIIWHHIQNENFPPVKLFLIASDGTPFNFNWKGQNNLTEIIVHALFPEAKVIPYFDFKKAYSKGNVTFEKALTSDRAMEFFTKNPFYMHRMLNLYYQDLKKVDISQFSQNIKNYLNVNSQKANSNLVNITYILRDKIRFLNKSHQDALFQAIQEIPGVNLIIKDFAQISFKDQVELVHNTNILIGAHGNGFSHTLFLNPDSTVIEMFPNHSLRCEYRVFSYLRDVNYYAWIDEEGLFSYEDLKLASERGDSGVAGSPKTFLIKPNVDEIVELIKKEVKKRLE